MSKKTYIKITRPTIDKKKSKEEYFELFEEYDPDHPQMEELYQAYCLEYEKDYEVVKNKLKVFHSIVIKLSKYLTEEELSLCDYRWCDLEKHLV